MTSEAWLLSAIPGFVTGSLALIGVIITGAWAIRRERKTREAAAKEAALQREHTSQTPTPPSTQEVWLRLDKLEKILRSAVGVISDVAEQWEGDHPPIISEKHYRILSEEGYWPDEWEPPLHK